jgi:predicted nucleic acid-binding protein
MFTVRDTNIFFAVALLLDAIIWSQEKRLKRQDRIEVLNIFEESHEMHSKIQTVFGRVFFINYSLMIYNDRQKPQAFACRP